jgi:calcineurin-like phosphoesterase family protein
MTSWFTSDLHFGHTNIIEYCNRPYSSVHEMDTDLVKRWNESVRSSDTVWIVGDLAMGKLDASLEYARQLNGMKLLVPGNHDRMFGCQGTKYRNMCARYEAVGVDVVNATFPLNVNGVHVTVCHFPYAGDSRDQFEDRYQDERPIDRGQFLVHGHTHGKWRKSGRMIDVGVDAWGGYPVAFETVVALFREKNDLAPLAWSA